VLETGGQENIARAAMQCCARVIHLDFDLIFEVLRASGIDAEGNAD